MPVITNRLAKGRPIETKRALAQAFTKAAAERRRRKALRRGVDAVE